MQKSGILYQNNAKYPFSDAWGYFERKRIFDLKTENKANLA